jgi:ElaB/YqjD/DUF883 family membrane-anchored ribosome-binding protein
MKKISKILSLVIVVGVIAAIPASTQIVAESGNAALDEGNLAMLILVNRLELSEEQMNGLHDILADLLGEREQMESLRAELEEAMIEFNGTGDELDAILATFREDQQALAEALRESLTTSLDAVRDLLSINQGIVLRDELPRLLGGGASLRAAHSDGRTQTASPMMENRMTPSITGRGSMMDQRQGQDGDDETIGAMREGMQDRLEQLGDRVPEELLEQLGERFGGVIETLGNRLGQNLGQMENRFGAAVSRQDGMSQRVLRDLPGERCSLPLQRMQSLRARGQGSERGNLFELLEQMKNVLELKIEAMM